MKGPEKKHRLHHHPVDIKDRYSSLSDTPAEKQTRVISSSILRNMKFAKPATIVNVFLRPDRGTMNYTLNCWLRLNINSVILLFVSLVRSVR